MPDWRSRSTTSISTEPGAPASTAGGPGPGRCAARPVDVDVDGPVRHDAGQLGQDLLTEADASGRARGRGDGYRGQRDLAVDHAASSRESTPRRRRADPGRSRPTPSARSRSSARTRCRAAPRASPACRAAAPGRRVVLGPHHQHVVVRRPRPAASVTSAVNGVCPPTWLADELAVDPHLGAVVDGPEVDQDPLRAFPRPASDLAGSVRRYQTTGWNPRVTDHGGRGLRRERHLRCAGERLGRGGGRTSVPATPSSASSKANSQVPSRLTHCSRHSIGRG